MKHPTLTDRTTSSYFAAKPAPSFEHNTHGQTDAEGGKLSFPRWRQDLWNTMSCGDPIAFGVHHYHPVTILCLERCLRLAHRHAAQQSQQQTSDEHHIHGYLMGSTTYTDDESGIVINVDRFDPGTMRSDGQRSPSTPLPGDVIVPIVFTKGPQQSSDVTNVFSVRDYQNTFKLLHHQVSAHLSVENTSLLPMRLCCHYAGGGIREDDVQLQLQWVTPCISNALQATPIKPVPIILTALAKNLSGPLNLSHIQNCSKTGYLSMNQSRKLLLLLDSDPKARSLPTVGIWVSGVVSVHNPVVWLACMRYLYCTDIYERIMTNDQQFLLVLYSVTSQKPMFFQVKSDDNTKINFELLYAQHCMQVFKNSGGDSENFVEFRLESSSLPGSGVPLKEREIFREALGGMEPFFAPRKTAGLKQEEDEDGEDIQPRGRQQKKASIPQSILRNNSGGRKSIGGRNRNLANGVSFSLAVDDSYSSMEAAPMPLPSPHPSTTHQSPSLIKPAVPELSLIFDENYPAPGQVVPNRQPSHSPTKRRTVSEKLNGPSPVIRSPLKNINNLNPANRGISPQDRRPGPMKSAANFYHSSMVNGNMNQHSNNAFFSGNQNQGVAHAMRRSRSASDCLRGPAGQNVVYPPRPSQRPMVPVYNSTPMQGYPNTIPNTTRAHYPPNFHPQMHQAPTRVPFPHPYTPVPTATNQPRGYSVSQNAPSTIHHQISVPYAMTNVQYVTGGKPGSIMTHFSTPAPHRMPAPMQTTYNANLLATPCPMPETQQATSVSHNATHLTHNANSTVPAGNHTALHDHGVPQTQIVTTTSTLAQPPGSGPIPSQVGGGCLPPESPGWMKQLPPEAYQLLMHQDAQLKQLQAQIQKLLAMQEGSAKEVRTVSTREKATESEKPEEANSKVSMGVNTGTSLYIPNDGIKEKDFVPDVASSASTTPASTKSSTDAYPAAIETPGGLEQTTLLRDGAKQDGEVEMSNPPIGLRCESQCTDKYQASEFPSILLDDSNLHKISTTNNEDDSDVRSLASSLRAVDLPVLETSTEQSSFNTPTSKSTGGMWSIQDSPVLGESASMCIVPPINLNKSLQEADEEEDGTVRQEEDGKDELFMTNLLSQVREMLKKADIDGTSEVSSGSSATSASRQKNQKQKAKMSRRLQEDRVARATKKQLQKMGVNLEEDEVNALSSAVARRDRKNAEDYPFTLPEPLIPRLNYVSIMAGGSASNSVFPGHSATDLSMHANAIALKYLSNDQLEEIATLSKLGKNTSAVFSPFKSKSTSSSPCSKDAGMDKFFGLDVGVRDPKRLTGMSLVSPCNMSLATRKYMEKYGLIDAEGSDEEEEEDGGKEENEPSVANVPRPTTPEHRQSKPLSYNESPVLKGIRYDHGQSQGVGYQTDEPQQNTAPVHTFSDAKHGFSELKMNLGDTLDMIMPFLDDLDRLRQQTPSSGTNGRDSRSGTRSSRTSSSRGNSANVERPTIASSDSPAGDRDSVERILSPQVLQALSQVQAHLNMRREKDSSRPNSRRTDRGHERVRDTSPVDVEKLVKHENEVSQVLSPKLLQALAEGRKMSEIAVSSARADYSQRSHREYGNARQEDDDEEDLLAGTWPTHQFRSRSESGDGHFMHGRIPESSGGLIAPETRRLSSSPCLPGSSNSSRKHHRHHEHRRHRISPPSSFKPRRVRAIQDRTCSNVLEDVAEIDYSGRENKGACRTNDVEEEEPVLTSRVTDAFREKEETTRVMSKEQSDRGGGDGHFLQHLQKSNQEHDRSDNFLDLEKIRNLPKLQ